MSAKSLGPRQVLAWLPIAMALGVAVPSLALRLGLFEAGPPLTALLTGAAILGAAFVLTWASEAAQRDVSQGLAVAAIALIAVLPEYAVDMYFAWMGAKKAEYCHYAVANMTGGNRLLLGVGWPLLVFLWLVRTRKTELEISPRRRTELGFLSLATAYAFLLPLKKHLSLLDTLVFFVIFAAYVRRVSREEHEEPELVGTAKMIGDLPAFVRRIVVPMLYLYAAAVIVASTEPFAEALLAVGEHYGIDKFLLVQWIAPLASESPEFAIAALFALRLHPEMSLGTLVSSKVNQWTLLVGMLPLTFCASATALRQMPLDPRQSEEVLLTACQSLFGLVVLANLRLSVLEALLLVGLFAGQLASPSVHARYLFSLAYVLLACLWLLRREYRQGIWDSVRTALGRMPSEAPVPGE
ncbi:MAG: sodium:calcium antiporter [Armatimonadetes bacterium]|nr:sodium:calcium antiporter [Armatimonadota bacterium]